MNITEVGIDLAKLVFQVHGVDARGKVALRKQLKRHQVVAFFAQLAPCLIGMEACGGYSRQELAGTASHLLGGAAGDRQAADRVRS